MVQLESMSALPGGERSSDVPSPRGSQDEADCWWNASFHPCASFTNVLLITAEYGSWPGRCAVTL
jgi:hypothetical protein